jgi:hypothetical protein
LALCSTRPSTLYLCTLVVGALKRKKLQPTALKPRNSAHKKPTRSLRVKLIYI